MTEQEIKDGAPNGATHYMDDEKGFDYVIIDEETFLSIWCSRFSCWLPYGYVALGKRFKKL